MSEKLNQENEQQEDQFGNQTKPIGDWWQPDPDEQYQECPIGQSRP